MSTILKALKQVDQTAPPEDIQSWPPKIDTKETVKTRVKKIRLNRNIYLAILLALIIMTAGWLAYNQKHLLLAIISSDRTSENDKLTSSVASEKDRIYQAKIYPPSSNPTASTAKKDSPSNMGNKRAGMNDEPKQTITDKQSRVLPKLPVRQNTNKNQNITLSRKMGSPPKPAPSKSRIPGSQKVDPKKIVRNQTRSSVALPPKKAKSPVKQVSRSYKRLAGSKLKLQAIAWSNDASQRIAVINDHVVREGESIEGFSVTQIRQDDIIVNDGTESWRLEFGLK